MWHSAMERTGGVRERCGVVHMNTGRLMEEFLDFAGHASRVLRALTGDEQWPSVELGRGRNALQEVRHALEHKHGRREDAVVHQHAPTAASNTR